MWLLPETGEQPENRAAGLKAAEAAASRVPEEAGWATDYCARPEELRERLQEGAYRLLAAELSPPGTERRRAEERWLWAAVDSIRSGGSVLPLLVVTPEGQADDAARLLERGANDYVRAPADPRELRARIANLLALSSARRGSGGRLEVDGLVVDPGRRQIWRDGRLLALTPKEFELLHYLMLHAGEVCGREEILRNVWGFHFHAGTNVVDVFIRHLRLKVDKGVRPKLIQTVRGAGYMLKLPGSDPAE